MVSVCVLVVSGLINAWYQVGDVPALIGTGYGRLLLAKLGLFAAILAIAVVNRGLLTPRLAGGDRGALRSLRRNAVLEIAAGIGIVYRRRAQRHGPRSASGSGLVHSTR